MFKKIGKSLFFSFVLLLILCNSVFAITANTVTSSPVLSGYVSMGTYDKDGVILPEGKMFVDTLSLNNPSKFKYYDVVTNTFSDYTITTTTSARLSGRIGNNVLIDDDSYGVKLYNSTGTLVATYAQAGSSIKKYDIIDNSQSGYFTSDYNDVISLYYITGGGASFITNIANDYVEPTGNPAYGNDVYASGGILNESGNVVYKYDLDRSSLGYSGTYVDPNEGIWIYNKSTGGRTKLSAFSYSDSPVGYVGNILYVQSGSNIVIYDTSTNTVVNTLPAISFKAMDDSKIVYTTADSSLYVYYIKTGATKQITSGLGYAGTGAYLYTVSIQGDLIIWNTYRSSVSETRYWYYLDYGYNPTLSATATQNSITVTFNTNDSTVNQSWELYDGATLIYSGTAISYTHSVTPGSTHAYKTRLVYLGGCSNYSSVLNATTVPSTPGAPTGTVSGISWSNDTNNPGRGSVSINWTAIPGATGYKVWLFDGNTYQMVQDVGNTLTWNSSVAKIYPSESLLDGKTDNTVNNNLFAGVNTGYNLPDTPAKLYRKTVGTTYDSNTNYWIKITAYNSFGESPLSNGYTFTLPDRTDTAAPTGSMTINDGAYNTANRDVIIAVSGDDSESGLYQMQFSLDNVSWTPWETFSISKTYQIGTNSSQTVYLKLKDNAGNVSNLISQSISFINDTEPPTITIKVNNGATQTFSNSVEITITAQDNLTTPENLKIRASLDGSNWYTYNDVSQSWSSPIGWSSYVANTKNFGLGASGGQKHIYVQVKDPSGNVGNSTATIFYVTAAVQPGNETTEPVANTSWGPDLNGKYVTVDGKVMMVVQAGSVTVSLTGISNSTQLITSFDGINWSQPDIIPSGTTTISKDVSFSNEGKKAVFVKLANDYSVESSIMARYYLVDNTAPTIEVKTASGATLTSSSSISLLVKAKDNVSTKLAYRINGGAWNQIPTNGIISSGSLSSGRNQLNVEVIDEAGNTAQEVVNVWKN